MKINELFSQAIVLTIYSVIMAIFVLVLGMLAKGFHMLFMIGWRIGL